MDAYDKAELNCRSRFSAWTENQPTISFIEFKLDRYDSTDVIFLSAFTSVICELKQRDYIHTHKWNNRPEGWVYEYTKHQALINAPQSDKYFCILFKNKVVIWNVGQMVIEFKDELLSSNSVDNPLKAKKKVKKVAYLRIEDASHIFEI